MALCSYVDLPATSFNRKTYNSIEDLSTSIQTSIRLARNSALKCEGLYRIGACATQKNQFCIGKCVDRTHPLQKKFAIKTPSKITLHAEIDALSKVKDRSVDIDCMVIVRITKINQKYASSMPCDICLGAIMNYNVKSLVFFLNDQWHHVDLYS